MTTINTIVISLLLVSLIFSVLPSVGTVSAAKQSDNPYSFQWWYKHQHQHQQQQQFQTSDNNDNDDDKKDSKKKHSSSNSNKQSHDSSDRKDIRYCANSGYWNGQKCVIQDEVEQAAYEDAVCDDPKDTQKYTSVCGGNSNNKVDEKRMVKEYRDANSGLSESSSTIVTVQPLEQQSAAAAINPHLADNDADDKIYKDFEKQYKAAHPEFYPEVKNPAEEPSENVVMPMPPSSNNNDDDNDDNANSNDDDDDDTTKSNDDSKDSNEDKDPESDKAQSNNDDDDDSNNDNDSDSDSDSKDSKDSSD